MHRWTLAALTGAALTMAAMPAQAAWKSYFDRDLGFSVMMPGDVEASLGTFRGQLAGPRQTINYRSMDNNIEYRVTVMNFVQAQAEGASLLGEREYMFQDKKRVLSDVFARVGSGPDVIYGRKFVIDLPNNKGRSTGAFYFTKGKLFVFETTVPANGNLASPDPDRFIDSVSFNVSRPDQGAIELKTPELD
jgi:hypothetical protein